MIPTAFREYCSSSSIVVVLGSLGAPANVICFSLRRLSKPAARQSQNYSQRSSSSPVHSSIQSLGPCTQYVERIGNCLFVKRATLTKVTETSLSKQTDSCARLCQVAILYSGCICSGWKQLLRTSAIEEEKSALFACVQTVVGGWFESFRGYIVAYSICTGLDRSNQLAKLLANYLLNLSVVA